ncbi:ABC transporter ATP-binding protein [Piscibacillus halophilus]|uniref:Putative ABC transport system ATP-binding protein n=1 Tax=Piscibacillus halophilus TaxID=571933 RepID=A0A1H8YTA8_9BACI|nr:ABC transporter ATP-binding protein [Piscibacillus halophilus]SEP55420.1 putative ABC transport system ATP-binding protein [Piscibacillus halophilus]
MDINVMNLSKTYESNVEQKKVLDQVTFKVNKGEWVNIIGRSGSGKTTLLKCLSGIMSADRGSIINIGDLPIHSKSEEDRREFRRQHIGYIYQDYQLFPAYTAKQNVMLPELPYQNESILLKRAEELMEQLNIEHRQDALPNQLSGGEQQRVAIARALLNNPDIFVCDEPTGNLDRSTRDEVLQILKQLQEEGRTILFVTHDYDVIEYGDRIFEMDDGRLEEVSQKTLIIEKPIKN